MKVFRLLALSFAAAAVLVASGCAGGGSGGGNSMSNEGGSSPINDKEAVEYKKALTRCYKTGGSRVVKINNYLHCY